MEVEANLAFPCNYICDTNPGWPQRNEPVVQARAKPHILGGSGDFLQLRIYPEIQPSWFAEIEIVDKNRGSAIFSTPDLNILLVKAGWRGYIVNSTARSIVELEIEPLRQVEPDLFRQILWCADWATITALAGDGSIRWRPDGLVDDDLEIVGIERDWVRIRGYYPEGEIRVAMPNGQLPECGDGDNRPYPRG